MTLKRTPLYEKHVEAKGKIIEFAGWEMPVQYEGLTEEHKAVRNQAGIFDVSHMGEVDVTGPAAADFVQFLVTNDASVLEDGQIMYALMCQEDGGVVDDLLVYKFDKYHFYLVINAANIDKDFAWIENVSAAFDVKVENVSDTIGEVAIQGPLAQDILQKVMSFDLKDLPFFYSKRDVDVAGVSCMVSRTGYTGEDGFEVYASAADIAKVWEALLTAGEKDGLKPAGLGARDTLRFEACLPLYGHEINESISPLEAGLSFFVKLESDDFIGREALIKQKENGISRKLVGFELDKGIARQGCEVFKDGQKIGFVTTGYKSPTLGTSIGLALVEREFGTMGDTFDIQVRKNLRQGKIISKRFYKKNYKK